MSDETVELSRDELEGVVEEISRRAYKAAWKKAVGKENYSDINIRTMESNFDTWWKRRTQ